MGDDLARLDAVVRGRVQGVGFRWFVHREAEPLGLRGWVRNTEEGHVAVVAAGDAEYEGELPNAAAPMMRAVKGRAILAARALLLLLIIIVFRFYLG